MPFNPKGKATISNKLEIVNGSGDDSIEHVDFGIKFEDQSCEIARAVLGVDTVDEVERGFFRTASEDADQNARFLGIKRISCSVKWEGKHRIKVRGLRPARVGVVSGVVLVPRGHARFDLSFKVRIDQPVAGYTDALAKIAGKAYDVEFEHDAELFDAAASADVPPKPKGAKTIRSGKRVVKKPAKKTPKRAGRKPASQAVA